MPWARARAYAWARACVAWTRAGMTSRGDTVLKAALAVLATWSAWFLQRALHLSQHRLKTQAYMPRWEDFWQAVVFAAVFSGLRLAVFNALIPVAKRVLKPKFVGQERQVRAERFATVVFKGIYFALIVTLGVWLFVYGGAPTVLDERADNYVGSPAPWMPASLGGEPDASVEFPLLHRWDTRNFAPLVRLYYMIAGGYHLHSLVFHVGLVARRSDFYEMFLHHAVTIFLIVFSYLTNLLAFGVAVFFVHDVPDLFVYTTKALGDTPYKMTTFTFFLGMMSSWFYMRLVVLPRDIIWPAYQSANGVEGQMLYVILLSTLVLLHAWWFLLFCRMLWGFLTHGSTEDKVDDISRDTTNTSSQLLHQSETPPNKHVVLQAAFVSGDTACSTVTGSGYNDDTPPGTPRTNVHTALGDCKKTD
ncbi:MAG: hypothetical protein MHM6MM_007763 [Cercozoa sp. M6MM]